MWINDCRTLLRLLVLFSRPNSIIVHYVNKFVGQEASGFVDIAIAKMLLSSGSRLRLLNGGRDFELGPALKI